MAEPLGIRRYGAHGISHQYVAGEAARFLGHPETDLSLITLHLGNGASAAAIRGGAPVDTSMGLTPLEGLVMGTRPGDVDAGVLLHLLRNGYDADRLEELLHHRSGLQGLAGMHDFRDLLAAVDRGEKQARTAYGVYCHRLRKYVGALPGRARRRRRRGLHGRRRGERASGPRGRPARPRRAGHRGRPGPQRRRGRQGHARIAADGSGVDLLVVPTDEELAIARQVQNLLSGSHGG